MSPEQSDPKAMPTANRAATQRPRIAPRTAYSRINANRNPQKAKITKYRVNRKALLPLSLMD